MGCHLVYQMDGAITVLYCINKIMCLCVLIPCHLPMEFIHVINHICTECDDYSHIHAVIFFL